MSCQPCKEIIWLPSSTARSTPCSHRWLMFAVLLQSHVLKESLLWFWYLTVGCKIHKASGEPSRPRKEEQIFQIAGKTYWSNYPGQQMRNEVSAFAGSSASTSLRATQNSWPCKEENYITENGCAPRAYHGESPGRPYFDTQVREGCPSHLQLAFRVSYAPPLALLWILAALY